MPQNRRPRPLVVDLYAGAGGLTEGFLRAGFDVRIAVDSDPWATETQRVNHAAKGVEVFHADIDSTKTYVAVRDRLKGLDLPVSVLVGGPPCQGFSTSNVQTRAKGNPNNKQVFTFIRYVRRLRPEIFVMENVPGLNFFDDGKLKRNILDEFQSIGYNVNVALLNSADFGVPQKRQRLIFVGNRIGIVNIFPPAMLQQEEWITVGEAISDLPLEGSIESDNPISYRRGRPSTYADKMRAGASNQVSNNLYSQAGNLVRERYEYIPGGGNWRDIPPRLMRNYADRTRCHRVIYRRLSNEESARSMPHVRKSMLIHPTENRGLTVREAARLQSFPDTFIFKGGIQAQQQQIANAVPPLLAQALASTILNKMIHTKVPIGRLRNMAPDLVRNSRANGLTKAKRKIVTYFRGRVVRWGKQNLRKLPWRMTSNPYRILVAEVLLQKTGTNLAVPAYKAMLEKYPDLDSLARADLPTLRSITTAIGLPKRADRLKAMAQMLIKDFHGLVPSDRIHLALLPGVGPYTASAVSCFAFRRDVPLVDSNIIRVFERFFGIKSKAERPRNDPALWRFAAQVLPNGNPVIYHQSLLDFSAAICTDKHPKCEPCPVRGGCATYKKLN